MNESYSARIEKVDFLASIPPGFYALLSIMFALNSIYKDRIPVEVYATIVGPNVSAGTASLTAIVVLFLTYLLGTILRSFPVNRVNKWVVSILRMWNSFLDACSLTIMSRRATPLRRRRAINFRPRILAYPSFYRDKFPYWRFLRRVHNMVTKCDRSIPEIKLPHRGKKYAMSGRLFDYWKIVLCQEAPGTFALGQSREARSRMFSGMILASVVGVICAVFAGFLGAVDLRPLGVILFLVSSGSLIVFARYFPAVRAQEARDIFLGYLVWLQMKGRHATGEEEDKRETAALIAKA